MSPRSSDSFVLSACICRDEFILNLTKDGMILKLNVGRLRSVLELKESQLDQMNEDLVVLNLKSLQLKCTYNIIDSIC